MVATIKAIMLAFDLSHGKMPVPSILAYAGYLSSPATVLFGPPLSYKEYIFIKEIQYELVSIFLYLPLYYSKNFEIQNFKTLPDMYEQG